VSQLVGERATVVANRANPIDWPEVGLGAEAGDAEVRDHGRDQHGHRGETLEAGAHRLGPSIRASGVHESQATRTMARKTLAGLRLG
jgi:hypothetical protein